MSPTNVYYASFAGVIEAIIMQPIDTIKTLKQCNQYQGIKYHIKNPTTLYKGLTPFVSQMAIKYYLRFNTFNLLKSKNDNYIKNFGAGITAGFIESLFITPFELLKTNLQTSDNKNPIKVIKNVYNQNGFKGLYRGFSGVAIRQSINQGFNFSIYYKLRQLIIKENEKPNIFKIMCASLVSSSIGPIINNPFDVIRTRFQNPKYNYTNLIDSCKDIIKNEGVKTLWKGIELRLVRVGGGQVIIFSIVENLEYYFNKKNILLNKT